MKDCEMGDRFSLDMVRGYRVIESFKFLVLSCWLDIDIKR